MLIAPGTGLGMACLLPTARRRWPAKADTPRLPARRTMKRRPSSSCIVVTAMSPPSACCRAAVWSTCMTHWPTIREHSHPRWLRKRSSEPAIDGQSERARRALDMFCAFLGWVAGNAALTFAARGGVLIAGGIAPRIVDYLRKADFRERFENKGRLRDYLARIPTRIVIRPDPAFLGLAASPTATAPSKDLTPTAIDLDDEVPASRCQAAAALLADGARLLERGDGAWSPVGVDRAAGPLGGFAARRAVSVEPVEP